MKGIKENFISKITYSAKKSTGLSLVLKLGTELCKKNPATNPEDKLVIGAGHPDDKNSRLVKYSLTYEENDILLNRSRDILFELFLTEIIQHWFTFLLEIYENALLENLRGGNKYPIKVSRLTLDLSKERDELIENIHENACRNFDFIKADEKLKTVKNLLNVNLVQIENDIKILKSNIKIRNILQHNKGIVKEKDLLDLNIPYFEEDHGNAIINIGKDKKISRTAFDIENLVDSLITISNTLIP